MVQFKRLDHFHVCVPPERLEEAKIFYADILGLELIDRPDHLFSSAGYWFNIGNVQLHIGVEPALPHSIRHTAFEVEDVDVARQLLQENNIEIVEEPVIPGRKRFAFIDPFGNRMELLQLI
ncbi:glyoxalase [Mucilaginibacter achroorhodeus]|uniref:Glyoxalase n=1 Tax=Mucilaginibacter achroorhodeus TaxID=2599294 RepID=A0A563TY25_9SPHI|nr:MULTISPECIES: VOC family protein [Mucilaginibacter]QXV66040.1 VOC family protein [Mucilaginibacter sp. 21P]TWR24254.1 glyoxalase [Mucilaginibacter achroorhodeus]